MTDPLADCIECDHPDWDGDGALPIRPETVDLARRVLDGLSNPTVAPGADGSICCEFYLPGGVEIWLDIDDNQRVRALVTKPKRLLDGPARAALKPTPSFWRRLFRIEP